MIDFLKKKYYAWRYQREITRRDFAQKTVAEVFTETYTQRYWKSAESVSGRGSELGQTAVLRAQLPALLHHFEIKTLLDLPCGDFNWMKTVDLAGIQYIGGDIVAELAATNQQQYGGAERQFLHLDLLSDDLPKADCILVRDCLVHLSNTHIRQALANIRRSGIRYLLTTHFTRTHPNEDIVTGNWRPLNFELAPFHFPPPIYHLDEQCTEANGAYGDKSLCLWEVQHLPDFPTPH